jgi:hypothetical protein
MAMKRPFVTYYSDGTVGRASTAQRAAHRAARHVIMGLSKTAQVYDEFDRMVAEVNKYYNDITIVVHRPKAMKGEE